MAQPAKRKPARLRIPVGPDGLTLPETAWAVLRAADPVVAADEAASAIVSAEDAEVTLISSRLKHFRQSLRAAGAPPDVIRATNRRSVGAAAAELEAQRMLSGRIAFGVEPDARYKREAVLARLAAFDTKLPPARLDLLDVMLALCLRPAEVRTLRISADGSCTGMAKQAHPIPRPYEGILGLGRAIELLGWIQTAITQGRLPNPGTGSKPYRQLLAAFGMRPKDLRLYGAEYAAEAGATDAARMVIRRRALRHAPVRLTAADHYSVMRRTGAPASAPPPAPAPAPAPGPLEADFDLIEWLQSLDYAEPEKGLSRPTDAGTPSPAS